MFGLTDDVIQRIQAVFRSFPQVKEVIIYGSRAKGNYKPGSDIDLAIKGGSIDLQTLNAISSALESLHTPYTFDLSVFANLQSDALISHIKRVGKIFYPSVT